MLSDPPKLLGTVGFQSPYVLQPPIPSGGGGVTSRSRSPLQYGYRNINRFVIGFPSRVPLRSRLTLVRLALSRKPWVCGAHVSACVVVTHAYIFFSGRSSIPHGTPSAPTGMLPYHSINGVLCFGGGLDARLSSTRHRSTSELLRTL